MRLSQKTALFNRLLLLLLLLLFQLILDFLWVKLNNLF